MTRIIIVALSYLTVLLISGCSEQPINHPNVNTAAVCTVSSWRDATRPSAEGDTVVIARLTRHWDYAQESTSDRNLRRHWFLTKFDVLRVEQGTWAKPEVSLITDHVWPTPESGIMLYMEPDSRIPPTYPAAIWALHLDTTSQPAKLLSFKERSLVPPHDKPPVPLDLEPADPNTPGIRRVASPERIFPPVEAFMASLGKKRGKKKDFRFGRCEQTETLFVIQAVSNLDKNGHRSVWTIGVDKLTGKASLLWSVA